MVEKGHTPATAENPPEDDEGDVVEIPVELWFVVGPPVWGEWPRRNWLAVVEDDPDSPGGVARTWCERGRGRHRYDITSLMEGDLIEFGADQVYPSGRRVPSRWYGEVVRVGKNLLRCRRYSTLEDMFSTVRDRDERTRECVR